MVADPPDPSRTDPDVARRDRLLGLGLAGLVAATVLLGALLPGASTRPAAGLPPSEDASCAEWSDGCRVCLRLAEGPACSLPGIACTPGEPLCQRRAGG